MSMECRNVGQIDQVIRMIVALILIILGTTMYVQYQTILLIIAVLLLLTVLFQYCPIYSLLNINTCEVKKAKTVSEAVKRTVVGQKTKSKRKVKKKPAKKAKKKRKKRR